MRSLHQVRAAARRNQENMAKYLVFGGSGFLGSRLIARLAKQDSNQIVVADVNRNPSFDKYENVSFQEIDFINKNSFAGEIAGYDYVYHLISTITPADGTKDAFRELEENVRPTLALLEEVKLHPGVRLIFLSSGGTVYGNKGSVPLSEELLPAPICNYGISKELIERYLFLYHHMYGLDYRILRLSNPYGTKARKNQKQGLIPIVMDCIMRGEPVTVFGNGRNVRDYIHVEDAISGVLKAAENGGSGGIYNIGFGVGYSILEIIDLIVKELGCEYPRLIFVPDRKCDVEYNVLDNSRMKAEFGWEPQICLEEGIRMMVNGIRNGGENG